MPKADRILQDLARLAERHEAVCFELLRCPTCEEMCFVYHPFLERVLCDVCGQSIPSRSPRLPSPGEPDALDYEAALNVLAKSDLAAAMHIRDLAQALASQRL